MIKEVPVASYGETPVQHGCRAPYTLLVDSDRIIVCSSCQRCWKSYPGDVWREVDCYDTDRELP